ncbi:unnamed protein product [Paramecium primaurelia]|uniref:Uncharacterized protein n=1 Tax=Paramecium primaurelia TaxID=5886 RepID=A0A8S1LFN4_PARPR|nr:unnamed protein product [Paramecium primaurelia]CAD8064353.1 unnamed protein product [Paramecium primaurelia]
MNLDQYQSTEDDWPQQSWNENEFFDISSSPIQFGRQTHKNKYENDISNQDFYSYNQQIEQPSGGQDINQISINSYIPLRKNKIRKNQKIKNKATKKLYQDIFSSIIQNTNSKQEVLEKLQQCQNMKVMIDGLEKSLMKIKYMLLFYSQKY